MKNLENILNDNLHVLYGDPDMKKVFPEGIISVTYRRGKDLKRTYLSFIVYSKCHRVCI